VDGASGGGSWHASALTTRSKRAVKTCVRFMRHGL
jgi:hypothetical protein